MSSEALTETEGLVLAWSPLHVLMNTTSLEYKIETPT